MLSECSTLFKAWNTKEDFPYKLYLPNEIAHLKYVQRIARNRRNGLLPSICAVPGTLQRIDCITFSENIYTKSILQSYARHQLTQLTTLLATEEEIMMLLTRVLPRTTLGDALLERYGDYVRPSKQPAKINMENVCAVSCVMRKCIPPLHHSGLQGWFIF